jgi:hypothetical protein
MIQFVAGYGSGTKFSVCFREETDLSRYEEEISSDQVKRADPDFRSILKGLADEAAGFWPATIGARGTGLKSHTH